MSEQQPELDDPQLREDVDPEGMLDRIHELPQQCLDAWRNVAGFNLPPEYAAVRNVVILGMGGSAIGGDLLRTLVEGESPVPVFVNREYRLPAFVDKQSLVIASSYSGNTEETLAGFEEAIGRGAKLMAITTGGRLSQWAGESGIPLLEFSYEAQPRAALGHSLIPLVGIMQKLGFIKDKQADLESAVDAMLDLEQEINEKAPLERNPAKKLASMVRGHLPIVYGAGILSEVARRWKGQFNENSKSWSFYETLPELNHNAVMGYENPEEMAGEAVVIFLKSALLHPRVLLRYQVTQRILEQRGVHLEVVEARGDNSLAHQLTTIFFGDYTSYYLAELYRSNPTSINVINYLKAELAKHPSSD
jgi:glucose/mannose-6-phosphate isomerase